MDETRNKPAAALRRYESMAARESLPALAWTAIGIRLEIAAKSLTAAVAIKFTDRAAEARHQANQANRARRAR